jgi:hypothetical protein
MNLPTAEASNAVVIAKNPAKGQFMVDDIPLAVILTGDPLNNYNPAIRGREPVVKIGGRRAVKHGQWGINGSNWEAALFPMKKGD